MEKLMGRNNPFTLYIQRWNGHERHTPSNFLNFQILIFVASSKIEAVASILIITIHFSNMRLWRIGQISMQMQSKLLKSSIIDQSDQF